jgi:hypothetical protein
MVIVAMLLIAIVSAATQTQAWRAAQAARGAFNGTRAQLAADEALTRVTATWNADSFANIGIGGRRRIAAQSALGDETEVTVARPAPLVAWLDATATSQIGGAHQRASRGAARALFLRPPLSALDAAITAITPVEIAAGARVSGDDRTNASDDCGPWRDTASIAGVFARTVTVAPGAQLSGAPPLSSNIDLNALQNDFDIAWPTIIARAQAAPIPPANAQVTASATWRALSWTSSTPILVSGNFAHRGTLAVNGDLQVQGRLRIEGLLVVRGTIDARIGTLEVTGALLVEAPSGDTSRFGPLTTVQYTRCTAQRALATIARPATAPFSFWANR